MASLLVAAGAQGLSLAERQSQAKIERGQADIAAQQEDVAVTAREADRKDRLATALASMNARAGAAGISAFEGSPLRILQDQIEREKVATERDVLGAELAALGLRTTGRIRQRQARTKGLISAGQFTSQALQTGFKPSK